MNYLKPAVVVSTMIQSGSDKIKLSLSDLLIRGILSGAILGFGTTLALTATVQTGMPIVGAAIFPACFVIVVLMGLELVTGSFAVLPMAFMSKKIGFKDMVTNLLVVFTANLAGGLLYAFLFWISLTGFGHDSGGALAQLIIKAAETKTVAYSHYDGYGWITAFTKGILCNWMVTIGIFLGLSSTSSTGKILAAWLPVFIFFGQGFEHAVVNMFLIPAGMLFGAPVQLSDWWLLNQIPVTLGNLFGGVVFTAGAMYITFGRQKHVSAVHAGTAANTVNDPAIVAA